MKGQANWESSSGFHMGLYMDTDGFPEGNYETVKMPDDVEDGDPFMVFGAITKPTWTPASQQMEIGLWNQDRIFINSNGVNIGNETDYLQFYISGNVPRMKITGGENLYLESDGDITSFHLYIDSTHYLRTAMSSTWGLLSCKGGPFYMRTVDNNSIIFQINGNNDEWAIDANCLKPVGGNVNDIGDDTNYVKTIYYCNLTDKTCAYFYGLTIEQLYNLLKWQPHPYFLHKGQNRNYKHIDFNSIPDEFAVKFKPTEEQPECRMKYLQLNELLEEEEVEVVHKEGDTIGIDKGVVDYAVKDLVLKLYEKIQNLELRIQILENN